MTDASPPTRKRTAALAFIFVTIVLDMLALGMIIPVLPRLVLMFSHGDTARAAEVFGVFGTAWALMQFIFSPFLGALSDRFGRRPVVLISNFGLGIDYVLMALAPSLGWLFVGRIISGITAASITAASAYVADVEPPERRAAAFGLLGAAFGLGFVLGPALGGLLGASNPRLPFWVAAGMSLLNAMYGLFVLPESLKKENRVRFQWRNANPVGSLALVRAHPSLIGLMIVHFLGFMAHNVLPSVFVLYAGYRYHWGTREVGLTLAGVGVCSGVVQGLLVRPIVARIGERGALFVGLAFGAAGFAVYGFATTGTMFWVGVPVMSLWGLADPAAQALMTRRVGITEQGRLQGALTSVSGITGMIAPGMYTFVFARSIGAWNGLGLPGAAFLVASSMLVGAMVVSVRAANTVSVTQTSPPV